MSISKSRLLENTLRKLGRNATIEDARAIIEYLGDEAENPSEEAWEDACETFICYKPEPITMKTLSRYV